MTAAAERAVTFGSYFYRWTARLLSCLGSSAAQGIGGRLIAAPTGRACLRRAGEDTRPYGGELEAALSLGGGARVKRAPSSGPSGPPTPFVPSGHFPLIGGIVLPPWRGKAFGRPQGSPYGGKRAGSLARQSQAQERNRTSLNFTPTQAPSGAGRNRTQALLILRAGRILPASRGNPRKWGTGERRL